MTVGGVWEEKGGEKNGEGNGGGAVTRTYSYIYEIVKEQELTNKQTNNWAKEGRVCLHFAQ